MKVQVLFFSLLRDCVGEAHVERSYAGRASMPVSTVLEDLYAEWPALRDWDSKVLVAVDRAYVERDAVVMDGQEIAVMPPVQGG